MCSFRSIAPQNQKLATLPVSPALGLISVFDLLCLEAKPRMAYGAMDGTPFSTEFDAYPPRTERVPLHCPTRFRISSKHRKTRTPRATREKLQLLWGDLLQAAVRDPGLLLDAYSRFHGYSLGNRLAALWQCHSRGLEPGPIHTYQGWKQLGYQVKSGEKALWLCMPLTRQVSGDGKTEKPYRNGKQSQGPTTRANGQRPTAAPTAANQKQMRTKPKRR